jgi:hypothetical protein
LFQQNRHFRLIIGRRIEYNNERRIAKIQSATRRRLEGKGRSRITCATPSHSRPGTATAEPIGNNDEFEKENVRLALFNIWIKNSNSWQRIFSESKIILPSDLSVRKWDSGKVSGVESKQKNKQNIHREQF